MLCAADVSRVVCIYRMCLRGWVVVLCRRKLGVPLVKPLGKHCDTCVGSDGHILDVDFVSTTFLSSNVHGVRHNYFHLNR